MTEKKHSFTDTNIRTFQVLSKFFQLKIVKLNMQKKGSLLSYLLKVLI